MMPDDHNDEEMTDEEIAEGVREYEIFVLSLALCASLLLALLHFLPPRPDTVPGPAPAAESRHVYRGTP
jgi:hypothetical protein